MVSKLKETPMSIETGRLGGASGTQQEKSVLQILDRLVRNLQTNGQLSQQIRGTLKAIHESTRADAVFWHTGSGGLPVVVGSASPEACLQMALTLLEKVRADEEQFLWSNHDADGEHHQYAACETTYDHQEVAKQDAR